MISGPTLAFITHEWNVFNIGGLFALFGQTVEERPRRIITARILGESRRFLRMQSGIQPHSPFVAGRIDHEKNAYPRETITPALSPTVRILSMDIP